MIQSLESIRQQTYPNIEHIIIDDGSVDGSADKIKEWINSKGYDCRFIRHEKNKGLSYTLNESIGLAKGEFWTVLATDDYILPERTELFVNYLQSNTGKSVVVSDSLFVDDRSQVLVRDGTDSFLKFYTRERSGFSMKEFGSYESLLAGNYIPSSFMIRKKVFDEVGLYNTRLSVEDWDMWLRISRRLEIGYIPRQLTFYRLHAANSIHNDYRITRGLMYTFLNQYSYCKMAGLTSTFKKLFERNMLLSLFKKPRLTFYFFRHSPFPLFIKTLGKRAVNKIFKRKRLHV